MKKRSMIMTALLSISFLMILSPFVAAQNLEDYGVETGDTFTYEVTTTIDEENTKSFMKFSVKSTSTVVGLTADFSIYNGSETIQLMNEPCYFIITQSDIEDHLETNLASQRYYGRIFVDVLAFYNKQTFDEIWVDIKTGAMVTGNGLNEDGNMVSYELVQWGDGNLQQLYESAQYADNAGSMDLPGYPFYIMSLISVGVICTLIFKMRKR